MSEILLGRPSNLHLGAGVSAEYVDGDVFNICQRLKEKHPKLYIVALDDGSRHCFAVMESCLDGEERLVKKYAELDQRMLADVDYMMSVPLKTRIAIIDRENAKWEEEWKEAQLEKLYDEMGGQMWHDLEACGFIQRPVSYPKAGVTNRKGSLAKSS